MTRLAPGPYGNEDGDVWVPRTVPYLEARRVAREWGYFGFDRDRLVYVGKSDAELLGFSRDCRCDEVCEYVLGCAECDHDHDGLTPCYREECSCLVFVERPEVCRVPAWHFRLEEA